MTISQKRSFQCRFQRDLTKSIALFAALIACNMNEAAAMDVTNYTVMEAMSSDQRSGFMLGLVEATAYARWLQDDKKTEDGMKCILNWFHDGNAAMEDIFYLMRKNPNYPPAPVLYVLANKRCPSK